MARFTPRLTAGVGVLVAFLLLGGSAAEAVADPGRSHSDRGNSSDRGNINSNRSDRGNGNGEGNRRGGLGRGDDYRRGIDNNRERGEHDGHVRDGWDGSAERGSVPSPEVQSGSGPVDLADIAELTPSLAGDKSGLGDGGADPGSGRVGVAELAPSLADGSGELRSSGADARVFAESGVADSPDRSGSYGPDAPKARFGPPRLTLGSGLTQGIRRGESEPRLPAPVLPPAPAAPPAPLAAPAFRAPAPPPAFVNRAPSAPVLTQQVGVPQDADWSDPLWGLTGLLLIPAAGAILGYRQARAAHAADRLRRS
ncbi:hypothetical protein [Mycolicibacterium tusciae]|uniref:hypothetical protein n=1 Tax=Mycolicibacterium tusciae TaxID=75922 RepID=UPI00024A36EA|nr:hypothetical protein [Mycolicibacterium tusciae]